jgi:hypothetical protein
MQSSRVRLVWSEDGFGVLESSAGSGGFEAVHIFGDDGSGRCWGTAKARALLSWQPKRR